MPGVDIHKLQKHTEKVKNRNSHKDSLLIDFLKKDIKLFKPSFGDKKKESFYLELSTMITAGLDIKASLEIAEKEQLKEKYKNVVRDIKHNLIKGNSFSDSLKKTGYFTPYEYYSLQIGEESGMLSAVLEQLASYYERKVKQRRQFLNALSYPMVIIFTSIGAVSFMLYFIVPMFSDIFKRFGGELPALTKMVISMSRFVSGNILYFFLILAGIFTFYVLNKQKTYFQKFISQVISYIPIFGKIYSGIYLARFCSSMDLLISAKVPLLRTLQLVKQMIKYYPIRSSIDKIEQDILNGESLYASMAKYTIYDHKMIALIKVAEEVNKLEVFFKKLSTSYTDDVEQKTAMLSTFLEPVMIVFLGIMIGFILVAMYLPMFQLSTQIGG